MIDASLHTPADTATNQAASLAAGLRADNPAVDKAVEDFEAVFVSLMLKEMRKTADDGGLFAGDSSDAYGGLFDLYLGQHIANAGGLGISDVLSSHLQSNSARGNQMT